MSSTKKSKIPVDQPWKFSDLPPVEEDTVNHPHHYTQGGIECIDALDAAVTGCPPDEAICVANVIKYVWRYTDKTPVESLKKARWYLDRLIGKVERRTQQ